MKVFSLFSGAGGFELGTPSNWEVVGFSEIDKHASAVLKYHYPNVRNYGDITKIKYEELPDFEMLTGGFPCQDLSVAGKRKGLAGARSGLFYTLVEVLKIKQPNYFILENVKGLLNSTEGWDFAECQIELAEAGYDIRWEVLDARHYGVPQKRERVFIIGCLRAECGREILLERNNNTKDIEVSEHEQQGEERFIASKYLGRNGKLTSSECPTIQASDIPHVNVGETVSYCLDSNYQKGTNTLDKSRRQLIVESGYDKTGATHESVNKVCLTHAIPADPDKYGRSTLYKNKGRVYDTEGVSPCLNTEKDKSPNILAHSSSGRSYGREERVTEGEANTLNTGEGCRTQSSTNYVSEGVRIRRLTPIECERLMSWPDNYTKYGNYGGVIKEVSDTQRYKMCGNGVVSTCVSAIIRRVWE